jgi:hypothetical protein
MVTASHSHSNAAYHAVQKTGLQIVIATSCFQALTDREYYAGRKVLFARFLGSEVALELPQGLRYGGLDTFHTTHWGLLSLQNKQKTPSSRCQDMVGTLVLHHELIITPSCPPRKITAQ